MNDWNHEQYLKFKQQRTMPAIDLASRIRNDQFNKIIDLGCGPGNSTHVLESFFPNADILGIDSSANMIQKASMEYPNLKFALCDINDINAGYDLIFSNACLQWLPSHHILIPSLIDKLNTNGKLAI